jgi:hypothetical protein
MNETLKEKFNQILYTLHYDENLHVLNSIINSEDFNATKNSLINSYNAKVNECSQILNELKSLSEIHKLERLDNSEVVINSTPKIGKEKEFNQKKSDFYNCYNKFQKLNDFHTKNNIFLNEFVGKSFEYCISRDCEKLMEKNEADVKNCIRDCFKFNQYNTYMMSNMTNDEFLKFQNKIEKL